MFDFFVAWLFNDEIQHFVDQRQILDEGVKQSHEKTDHQN
jgi:hypothetical protein